MTADRLGLGAFADELPGLPPLPSPPAAAAPEPEDEPHTEATLLDLVRRRYTVTSQGTGQRYVYATHVRSGAGFDRRTADAVVMDLWESERNALHGFEVKCTRSDWLRELKDPTKAEAVMRYCDHWWVVAPTGVVRGGELPTGWGLLVPGAGSLRAVVKAPRLEPVPLPRGFVAALLRATVKTEARRHQP